MVLFIIFGTRGCTFKKDTGQFHCPSCGPSEFVHKNVRCFFTLYFIPVIPLHQLGEYVECNSCSGTYDVKILDYDPEKEGQSTQALFMVAMKQVMIAMLLADGVIDDDEVTELQATFEDLAGVPVTEQDLREEIAEIQAKGSDAVELIKHLGPGLNEKGKEMVITAAFQIAAADGNVDASERQLLDELGAAMEVSKAHFRGMMAELEESMSG